MSKSETTRPSGRRCLQRARTRHQVIDTSGREVSEIVEQIVIKVGAQHEASARGSHERIQRALPSFFSQ